VSPQQLVPWASGLNRATGATSQSPAAFSELVNAMLLDATLRLRPAIGAPVVVIPDVDDICFVGTFQGASQTVYITFIAATRAVDIYTADLQGNNPVLLGNWGTLDAGAATPPCFSIAESFSILLLAHDEEDVTKRLVTQVYDPAGMTELSDLEADLVNDDPESAEPVLFRWVATHLGYIFAGGYGNAEQPSRPELVRLSHPDDPTLYDSTDYVIVGEQDNPSVGGISIPVGTGLATFVVGKPGQLWTIEGQDRTTWNPQPLDPTTGLANIRSWCIMEGLLYLWSSTGPYVTDGRSCTPAGLDLDLPQAYPADLPDAGPSRNLWALALPDERHVVFFCPDPQQDRMLGYILSARTPDTRRWGLWVAPRSLHGAVVSSGFAYTATQPGYADPVTTEGTIGLSTATVDLTITHNEAVGDETVEVWYKPDGGGWTLALSTAIDTSGATQDLSFTVGVVSGDYTVAVRYRRLGQYRTGYTSTDPDDWPAGSLATGTVVVVGAISGLAIVYDHDAGTITATWTASEAGQGTRLKLRGGIGPLFYVTEMHDAAPGDVSYVFPYVAWNPSSYPPTTAGEAARVAALGKLDPNSPNPSTSLEAGTLLIEAWQFVGSTEGAHTSGPMIHATWSDAEKDGADIRLNTWRSSVALGTDVDFVVDRPTSQHGALGISVYDGNFGAVPPNGSCTFSGLGPIFSGTELYLNRAAATDTAATPFTLAHVPMPPCATCLIVGQLVYMGTVVATLGFAKNVGNKLPHAWSHTFPLPPGALCSA
jgi:hypothetical protein